MRLRQVLLHRRPRLFFLLFSIVVRVVALLVHGTAQRVCITQVLPLREVVVLHTCLVLLRRHEEGEKTSEVLEQRRGAEHFCQISLILLVFGVRVKLIPFLFALFTALALGLDVFRPKNEQLAALSRLQLFSHHLVVSFLFTGFEVSIIISFFERVRTSWVVEIIFFADILELELQRGHARICGVRLGRTLTRPLLLARLPLLTFHHTGCVVAAVGDACIVFLRCLPLWIFTVLVFRVSDRGSRRRRRMLFRRVLALALGSLGFGL